ncbi:hypothetical protein HNR26_003516 [Rhizobium rosettiformans]|uniref:Uncharacterized protein n=2 Tax=Rhizobium rosettiformans TaxID=1368430 RepID=A0A4S8PVK8_9HYPH|nr:hypothetical protein [Rhizobium rosettiformans]MBB5277436.1 hypothetical protein [Rhizobium rosettiformans]THV33832.1 hypothetical protein FAA86_17580 [Rhizobium rosettiformans W3]
MHEVYAAIAITALKREIGQKEQMSEDAFYAQYSEAPWTKLLRLSDRLKRTVRRRQEARDVVEAPPGHACRLADA